MFDYKKRLESIEKGLKPAKSFFAIMTEREFEKIEKGEMPRPKGMVVILPDSAFLAPEPNRLVDQKKSEMFSDGFGPDRLTSEALRALIEKCKKTRDSATR